MIRMEYLDFEAPIRELDEQIAKATALEQETGVSMEQSIDSLIEKRDATFHELAQNLTAWQRVQLSRHPNRPYTLAYINAMTNGQFSELHGDRYVKDDKAMVGGWGWIDGESFMFVGQQKGINTKMRQLRNFGMANPDGYRKALRLFKQAEKFGRPIVTLIDTPRSRFGRRPWYWGGRPRSDAGKHVVLRNQSRILFVHPLAQLGLQDNGCRSLKAHRHGHVGQWPH